jgi:superfamily II DNA or RNA helicase
LHYADITDYLESSHIEYVDEALELLPVPRLEFRASLRDYQTDALDSWIQAGKRGTVVLPTGAGKTIVAVGAIGTLQTPSLVIVPTLDLVEQWRRVLAAEFSIEIGTYGGGENVLKPLTVSTYDSAYLRAAELGNRFGLVIFDEVHHLPAPGYRHIAEMFVSKARLGLTATYERADGLHSELQRLIGGKVYELTVQDLAEEHLSGYEVAHLFVDLMPDEAEEYTRMHGAFIDYIERRNILMRTQYDFSRFIMRSGWDPEARKALLARNRALDIALNSRAKMEALKELLLDHPSDQTMSKGERREILGNFHDGVYRMIVTSKVLDEGVDVPDAAQAIILSGTGSSREFIQRLGRVLRKREGKRARLTEIVTRDTTETKISHRRKRKWRDAERAT